MTVNIYTVTGSIASYISKRCLQNIYNVRNVNTLCNLVTIQVNNKRFRKWVVVAVVAQYPSSQF